LIALDGIRFAAELSVGSKCRTQSNRLVEVGDRAVVVGLAPVSLTAVNMGAARFGSSLIA
jgi:hypothetical protein